jgi:hypothetical protein
MEERQNHTYMRENDVGLQMLYQLRKRFYAICLALWGFELMGHWAQFVHQLAGYTSRIRQGCSRCSTQLIVLRFYQQGIGFHLISSINGPFSSPVFCLLLDSKIEAANEITVL